MFKVTLVSDITISNDTDVRTIYELFYRDDYVPNGTIAIRAKGEQVADFWKCPEVLGTAIQDAGSKRMQAGRGDHSLAELEKGIRDFLDPSAITLMHGATCSSLRICLREVDVAAAAQSAEHRSLVAGFELYQLKEPITAENVGAFNAVKDLQRELTAKSIEHARALARHRLLVTEQNMYAWADFTPLVVTLKEQLTEIALRYAASWRMCRFGSRSRDIAAALGEFREGMSAKWQHGMADVRIQQAIFAEVGLADALSEAQRAGQSIRRERRDPNLFSNYCWQLNGDAWAKANPYDMAKRRRDLMASPGWMMRVHQGDLRPSYTFRGGAISHLVVAGGAVPYHTDTLFGKWRATSQTVARQRSSDVDEHSVDGLSNHYIIIEAWMKATVGKNRDAAIWYDEQWVEAAGDMQRDGRAALEYGMVQFDVESLKAALSEINLLTLQVNWDEVRYRSDRAYVSRNWPGQGW